MLKSSRQAGSLAKRIIIILIMSVLLLSAAACNRKGPPKSGILTDDYELTIEGEVVFTISNESGAASEAAAPRAFADAFMRKYPEVKVTVDEAHRNM